MKITFTQRTAYQIIITVNSLDSTKRDFTPQYKNSKFDAWHNFTNPAQHVNCVRFNSQAKAENHIYAASKSFIAREEVVIGIVDQTQKVS